MKRCKYISLSLILGMVFLIGSAQADFLFTTDAGFSLGAGNFNKYDIISTNGSGSYAKVLASLSAVLPPEANIDALQTLGHSTTLFSLGEDAVVQGTLFSKQDLILWNGTTATLFWSGAVDGGLPPEVNLDAVYVENLNPKEFSFSLGEGTQLTIASVMTQVSKSDIIRWKSGQGFTGKDFDAVARSIPAETNLDTFFEINSATQWVLSFDAQALIPSSSANLYGKSDLISYNPTSLAFTATPYFNGISNNLPPEVNIDGATNTVSQIAVDDWFLMY